MKIHLDNFDIEYLKENLKLEGMSEGEKQQVFGTLPKEEGDWFLPDFSVETIREEVKEFQDKTVFDKMEKQTVRGVLHLDLRGSELGQSNNKDKIQN